MTYGRNKAISATAVPPKKIQPATATAVLSFFFFLFLFFLLYSLLLAYGSVMVRFSRPARRRFRSFIFRKKSDIFFICFLQVFRCFSIVFFHSSSQDIPVRERPFSV